RPMPAPPNPARARAQELPEPARVLGVGGAHVRVLRARRVVADGGLAPTGNERARSAALARVRDPDARGARARRVARRARPSLAPPSGERAGGARRLDGRA